MRKAGGIFEILIVIVIIIILYFTVFSGGRNEHLNPVKEVKRVHTQKGIVNQKLEDVQNIKTYSDEAQQRMHEQEGN